MSMTLVEAAKLALQAKETIKSAVIEMFARRSNILMALPFESIPGGVVKYNREGALPGIAFRGVNESYTKSTGVINPGTDSVVIAGGDLDVDRFIVETQGVNVRATHEAMKVKALADSWQQKFFKGDSGADPREGDGLQVRLTGDQLIDAGSASGGDALSLAKLDELIDAVDDPNALLMSKALNRLITAASRLQSVGGHVSFDKDEFGRRITMYNGLPILTTQNGATNPLDFVEANPGGGSAVGTSIYAVSFGPGKLMGIQNGGMDVRDLGELNDAPKYRTRVEWYAWFALYHGRAAARLRGIKNAAVVA